MKLDEENALIRFDRITYFDLYKQTANFSHRISEDDYRELFEVIWKDRCKNGGWDLEIEYKDKTVEFKNKTKDINYSFIGNNVKPFDETKPITLDILNLSFPNEQAIDFHWKDNKKEGYPIAFSVTNTNKYYNVYNIESYAIPNLDKEEIAPTNWQKFKKWVGGNSDSAVKIGIGVGIGYLLFK